MEIYILGILIFGFLIYFSNNLEDRVDEITKNQRTIIKLLENKNNEGK